MTPGDLSLDRRGFHQSLVAAAFGGLLAGGCSTVPRPGAALPYGALQPDPAGLLDLPPGFSYRIVSRLGERMDDGEPVPDRADGMGAFAMPGGRIALVRNHELSAKTVNPAIGGYDQRSDGATLAGGTTTLLLDGRSGQLLHQFRSLGGTIRNCAGGVTPWRSWLSCEEDVTRAGNGVRRDHGFVFEVPVDATRAVEPVALTAMGRFNHEAAAVDPRTGIVYLTEDRDDGLFYRFLPHAKGRLGAGGRLQALALTPADTRNWNGIDLAPGTALAARWIDLDGVEAPDDDLRLRGARQGGALFARGEGIHMDRGQLYFTATSGGAKKLGQIFRYRPAAAEGQAQERDAPGRLDLFFESQSTDQLHYGDNLTVGPNGHLFVCEDQPGDLVDNYIRGFTPFGTPYPFARLHRQTEWAGACFAPNGRTLFVNAYSPTMTIAISGPF